MTTILEIQKRGLRVRMNNQITLIASYSDEGGVYFFNQDLQKQYVNETVFETSEKEEKEEKEETSEKEEKEVKIYSFYVEYEHKGRSNGFALTEAKVKAKDIEEAIEKIHKRFRKIYEISEA